MDRKAYYKEQAAAKYTHHKELGLCVVCGELKTSNGTMCKLCNEEGKQRQIERYAWAKAFRICTRCHKEPADPGAATCVVCRKEDNNRAKSRQQRLKIETLTHYSNGEPHCDCCGEVNTIFLTLHHVNGDGAKHRKEAGISGGPGTYYWLKKRSFPDGFRVLCHNCNNAVSYTGSCPHEND